MPRVTVYLDQDEMAFLEAYCRDQNCSMSRALKTALRGLGDLPGPTSRTRVPGTFDIVETDVGRQLRLERELDEKGEALKKKAMAMYDWLWGTKPKEGSHR